MRDSNQAGNHRTELSGLKFRLLFLLSWAPIAAVIVVIALYEEPEKREQVDHDDAREITAVRTSYHTLLTIINSDNYMSIDGRGDEKIFNF